IPAAVTKEIGMIAVRIRRRRITAETFLFRIVIMIHHTALPVILALYPEMIVRFLAELATARLRFMQPLGQDDGCRDTGTLLLGHRQRLIGVHIEYPVRADLRRQPPRH